MLGFHCIFRFPDICSFSANFQLALNTVPHASARSLAFFVSKSGNTWKQLISKQLLSLHPCHIVGSLYEGTINSCCWGWQVLEFQNRYNILNRKPMYSTYSFHRVFLIGRRLIGSVSISWEYNLQNNNTVDIVITIFRYSIFLKFNTDILEYKICYTDIKICFIDQP